MSGDSGWPEDARCVDYVGSWKYFYRENGHQTTTDDVLIAYVALFRPVLFPELVMPPQPSCAASSVYVDLGCGIGSTLLLVAHSLCTTAATTTTATHSRVVGIEAQEQSALLVRRAAEEINGLPRIEVLHMDIRELLSPELTSEGAGEDGAGLLGRCGLVTANPPYAALGLGTHHKDAQRVACNFELRGGVEEYARVAARLLAPGGRFVLAFWHAGRERVERACMAAGLCVEARLDCLMGSPFATTPHLSVFEVSGRPGSFDSHAGGYPYTVRTLDIRRDPVTNGLSANYKAVQKLLHMHPRPLRRPAYSTTRGSSGGGGAG